MVDHPGPAGDELLDVVPLGPGVLAGFTSRAGGASSGPWAGLNLGLHVGDDPEVVAANRRALARRVGVPVEYATQVHGADVVLVPDGRDGDRRADALVTVSPDVAVAVYVADCAPVLLADPVARVVAAVHAGRPGLVAGVLQAAVAAMVRAGADPARTVAAVGPCIAGRSYEVPDAMRDDVAAVVPEAASRTEAGTAAVDLAAGVHAVLRRCGVTAVHVDGRDTYADPALYSHRRATHERATTTGRFAGVVRLLGPGGPPGG
ncbi:peptidoglycan editing factor PgeF [Cellulomonas phragmiteti]|uniref:Purine nucleoside phosphorylase n=1 Tax=Cellulomonas phragmiteti TaxID=478780 RepID=A0ABQ4DHS0_9CELL|nr:peptidoglycan editing factor PgeF [Cellulomonas phragmiteti]GIG38557.1 laccase domain protein [Cellulomonas phragmiteti]